MAIRQRGDVRKLCSRRSQASCDASRAPIAGPDFIGAPTAPTPTIGDNDEKLATTAFVTNAAFVMGNALPSDWHPLMDGNPPLARLYCITREDHVHP